MEIEIIATGGTIDKIYFDAQSEYEVGEPQIGHFLKNANLTIDYRITSLLRKDSLDLTDADRSLIRDAVKDSPARSLVITHGTDTMIDTARHLLAGNLGKTIVLTGAMQPAGFRSSDAVYNVASAMTAAQLLPAGVYLAMNGRIFDPSQTRKNRELKRFETL